MVNILVVDDNPEKINNISTMLEPFQCENVCIIKAYDINGAKRELKKKNVDIMILDIYLPQTFGDTIYQDGGMKLLREIRHSKFYSYPRYVISLSGHETSTKIFENSEGNIHTAIYYDITTNEWENKLVSCVQAAISIVSNTVLHRLNDYDIAVICALKEEVDFIKEALLEVEQCTVDYDDDLYYKGYFLKDNSKVRVVFSSANQMGMVATTSLATKMINNFAPKYMVMTGIAGGTKPEKMDFGDVIVASASWDYRAGKDIRKDNEAQHLNTILQITIDTKLINYCRRLSEDTKFLREMKDNFKMGEKPKSELQVLIGPVVSGASVVTDAEIVKDILNNQDRTVLAIEMEIYGMYYAASWAINPRPKFIALKAISDFANSDKGDKYHKYASYTSAMAFVKLATEYFIYDE
jgi:nucleoside phosphorylase/CheY-like chemotaxis protein